RKKEDRGQKTEKSASFLSSVLCLLSSDHGAVAVSASLAQSAVQLPWLAPGAPALAALARGEPATHPSIAADPAAVLLLLRHSDDASTALAAAYRRLREPPAGVID